MKSQSYTDGADGVCYLTLALSLKEVSRRGLIKGSHQSPIERASNESSEYSIVNYFYNGNYPRIKLRGIS